MIKALFFGQVPYLTGLRVQEYLFNQIITNKTNEHYLCMFEHNPPVYTVGIRESLYTEETEQKVKKLGAEFYRVKRGGLITFHGPGQLVAYPIFNLTTLPIKKNNLKSLSVRQYIYSIEQVLILMLLNKYKIENVGRTENAGVWIENYKKIAAIGIQIKNNITLHGLALNCETDLKWFDHIIPCGLHNKSTTSLTIELNKQIKVEDVIKPLCESFENIFELPIILDINAKHNLHKFNYLYCNQMAAQETNYQKVNLPTFLQKDKDDKEDFVNIRNQLQQIKTSTKIIQENADLINKSAKSAINSVNNLEIKNKYKNAFQKTFHNNLISIDDEGTTIRSNGYAKIFNIMAINELKIGDYYEITFINAEHGCVGICPKNFKLFDVSIGTCETSYGYTCNVSLRLAGKINRKITKPCESLYTLGVGLEKENDEIYLYFTKNGILTEKKYIKKQMELFPVFSMMGVEAKGQANFGGEKKFLYKKKNKK